jgi:hypothetical protein
MLSTHDESNLRGWTDEKTWTDADGTKWRMRNDTPVAWPRLLHLRVEVDEATLQTKVAGRVRFKKVPKVEPCSRNSLRSYPRPVAVYHVADANEVAIAPDHKEAFEQADRQQASSGKYKGQWFISPRLVAKRLEVDHTLVFQYRKNGIPWMLAEAGCQRGQKRKPVTMKFKYGYYGRNNENFWLESQVEEFAMARREMPEALEGFSTVKSAADARDISVSHAREKMKSKELGCKVVPLKIRQAGNGKRDFFFTSRHQLVPNDQLNDFRKSRMVNSAPDDRMTVIEVALLFKCSIQAVYHWIYHGTQHLNGAKLRCTKGPALWTGKRDGKPSTQLKENCILVFKSDVKAIWVRKYPDKPFPIPSHIAGHVPVPAPSDASGGLPPVDSTATPPTQSPEDWKAIVAAVADDNALAIINIAGDKAKTTDQKMRAIYAIDNRVLGWDSPKWSSVLHVTDAAVRKCDWWKQDRPRLIEDNR